MTDNPNPIRCPLCDEVLEFEEVEPEISKVAVHMRYVYINFFPYKTTHVCSRKLPEKYTKEPETFLFSGKVDI